MIFQSSKQPFCRYCGKRIAKQTRIVNLALPGSGLAGHTSIHSRVLHVDTYPADMNACKALTNGHVVTVRFDRGGHIDSFFEWDGTSYKDEFFCSGTHAKLFAYVVFVDNPQCGTPEWHKAMGTNNAG